jgi:hypothetical protein
VAFATFLVIPTAPSGYAQQPQAIRGTIDKIDGGLVSIKQANGGGRGRYQPPNELPPRLLALVGELREKHATALGPEAEKLIGDIFLAIMAAVITLIFYKHIVIF